jgi:hypothetical protein
LNLGPAGASPETTSLLSAPNGEIALLVGAALLTLLVVAFVIGLIVTIVREERAVGRANSGSKEGDTTKRDSHEVPEAQR